MKTKLALSMSISALLVAGCMQDQATSPMQPLTTAAVSGKVSTAGETSIFINPNGTLSGSGPAGAIVGTWEVKNGQWCRVITEPAAWASSRCQQARLDGNVLSLPNADGTAMVNWTLSEPS